MISFIFPTYNEERNVEELYKRLIPITKMIKDQTFEFVFVDDGSQDKTPAILKTLRQKDPRLKIVQLTKNFGSHAAIGAGLEYCKGDCAIVLVADLQDPPEVVLHLYEQWKNAKIVWAVPRQEESSRNKFFSKLYYFVINTCTSVKVPPVGTGAFLIDRQVIDVYTKVQERDTSVFMTLISLGFPQVFVDYVKKERYQGRSKWTLQKKIKLFIDSIFAFSDKPVRFISVTGFIVLGVGVLLGLGNIASWLASHGPGIGHILLTFLFIFTGLQMIAMGILGEYILRTYNEARKKPFYIVQSQSE